MPEKTLRADPGVRVKPSTNIPRVVRPEPAITTRKHIAMFGLKVVDALQGLLKLLDSRAQSCA
jgi:hypothetical protein